MLLLLCSDLHNYNEQEKTPQVCSEEFCDEIQDSTEKASFQNEEAELVGALLEILDERNTATGLVLVSSYSS